MKSKKFWENFICRLQMPVNAEVVFIGFVSVFPPSSSIPQDNNPKFLQVEAREFSSVS